ncbi:hypothetical protein JTE90_005047 [Oedothorax gibbosus]|uniref:Uncharacterized protein n=1 Tax=Oedothorax gibbosus TaxID=931172 RepID=A0AAV6VCM9_9ARAC|nr:hypothetical protein JTE90_005047 [Oedothorax gibbosus]
MQGTSKNQSHNPKIGDKSLPTPDDRRVTSSADDTTSTSPPRPTLADDSRPKGATPVTEPDLQIHPFVI